MKTMRRFSIFAILCAILFSTTACEDGSGGSGGNGGTSPKVLTSVAEVAAYLATASGGSSVTNPVAIACNFNLGTMTEATSGWQQLVGILDSAGKYVSLELSRCTMTGTEFNAGNSYVVSLVLPDMAREIYSNSFNNLVTCSGANVTTVGDYAFNKREYLQNASFPAVQSIGEGAFEYCTALQSISFPAAANVQMWAFGRCPSLVLFNLIGSGSLSVIEGGKALVRNTELLAYPTASGTITLEVITIIGGGAFGGCTTLQSASFPAVTSIVGITAFGGCTALHSLNIPAVTFIGDSTFNKSGNIALTITMGNTAPTLGREFFIDNFGSKHITIRVPAAALASYDTDWQTAFTDGNTDITLSFVTY